MERSTVLQGSRSIQRPRADVTVPFGRQKPNPPIDIFTVLVMASDSLQAHWDPREKGDGQKVILDDTQMPNGTSSLSTLHQVHR